MNDELYHWGIKRKHKYVEKVKEESGKYRYFYSQEEYDAYLKGKNAGESTVSKFVNTGYTVVNSLLGKYLNKNSVDKLSVKQSGDANVGIRSTILSNTVSNDDEIWMESPTAYPRSEYETISSEDYTIEKTTNTNSESFFTSINTNYSSDNASSLGYRTNCAYCTLAYAMRKKGYDVVAKPNDTYGGLSVRDESYLYYTKEGKLAANAIVEDYNSTCYDFELSDMQALDLIWNENSKTSKKIANELKTLTDKYPNKSYGSLSIAWNDKAGGGGHSVAWEKDSNGTITIYDCQTQKKYSLDEYVQSHGLYIKCMGFFRTDEYDINIDEASNYVKNSSGTEIENTIDYIEEKESKKESYTYYDNEKNVWYHVYFNKEGKRTLYAYSP